MTSVYGEVISFLIVVHWCREFEDGRQRTQDLQRASRPQSIMDENVANIENLILENRGIKLTEINKILDISYSSVHKIITKQLKFWKLCAR